MVRSVLASGPPDEFLGRKPFPEQNQSRITSKVMETRTLPDGPPDSSPDMKSSSAAKQGIYDSQSLVKALARRQKKPARRETVSLAAISAAVSSVAAGVKAPAEDSKADGTKVPTPSANGHTTVAKADPPAAEGVNETAQAADVTATTLPAPAPETAERPTEPAPPTAPMLPPLATKTGSLTATQKTRRKIVIQPLFTAESAVSSPEPPIAAVSAIAPPPPTPAAAAPVVEKPVPVPRVPAPKLAMPLVPPSKSRTSTGKARQRPQTPAAPSPPRAVLAMPEPPPVVEAEPEILPPPVVETAPAPSAKRRTVPPPPAPKFTVQPPPGAPNFDPPPAHAKRLAKKKVEAVAPVDAEFYEEQADAASGEPELASLPKPLPRMIGIGAILVATLIVIALGAYVYLKWNRSTPPPVDTSAMPLPSHTQFPAVPHDPVTAEDYSTRAMSREGRGDLDGALSDFDMAVSLDPRNIEILRHRAALREVHNDLPGALNDYDAILAIDPHNAEAFSDRGFVKQTQGELDGALADYTQALSINPAIAPAYYNEGLIKVQQGNLDGAIADYNQALQLDPKMANAYYNRGNAKNSEGDLDGAIADYTQALALNPGIALAYCNRGFARQSKGDSAGALTDYTKAVELNPRMAVAYYNRGLIKCEMGDLDGAIADSSSAIDFDPKDVQAYCNRGLAQLGKGDFNAAEGDLRKFADLAPRDIGADAARLYLWTIATRRNPHGTADQDLSTAYINEWNSSPEDLVSKVASYLLGHIRESELVAAAASPDKSREPGQYCKVWYFVGIKHRLMGDTAGAATDFRKCIATNQKDFCEYLFARTELATLGQTREASTQSLQAAP